MKLYEFAVVVDERRNQEGVVVEDAKVVVPVTAALARDDAQAQLLAARAIPEEFVVDGRLDRLTVVVRPF